MHVLYVEDNELNQALVGRVMKGRKHAITFREDGEGALEVLANNSAIDLVLLDIELAGIMDGLDVVKALRDRGDMRPVVAVTAYAMMGDRERIMAAGCDQYLPKPLVIADLIGLIDHYAAGPAAVPDEVSATDEVAAPDKAAATVSASPATPEAPEPAPAEVAPEAQEIRVQAGEVPARELVMAPPAAATTSAVPATGPAMQAALPGQEAMSPPGATIL